MSLNDNRLAADLAASRSKEQVQRILDTADSLRASFEQQLRDRDLAIEILATEAATMRSAIDQTIGWQQSVDPENTDSIRLLLEIDAPATAAFLNAVRAEGVDMLARKHQQIVDTLNGDSLFADREREHSTIAAAATYFAAQLRSGETS